MALKPNELGFYDMSGNVFEWCQDWYAEFSLKSETDPLGPETGEKKVIKGGSYFSSELMCYPGYHYCEWPDKRKRTIGFRLVIEF